MRVAVVGGTGFVGSHLVPQLLQAGHEVRVVGRGVRSATLPPGLAPTFGDVISGEGLEAAFQSADAVVNLVAVIRERGLQTFEAVNAQGTGQVAAAASRAGVRRLVQFSAIGADPDPNFPYLLSKWRGEQAVAASALEWVVIRSSTIFGKGDGFFTLLAKAISLPAPFLVIPGDGTALFQPIDAADVARCLLAGVEEPERARHLYEIGGPDQVSLEQITIEIAQVIDKEWFGISKRKPLHLDPRLIRPGAMVMDKVLAHPLVTPQQLDMLAKPNITRLDAVRTEFGFEPRPMWGNLGYLKRPGHWPKLAA
ncbi:MAG TPA: complex I NDUFA9 subunit family protein [Candidatus Dormibacteraeota bacterium]|nr:complex I NDUFA9 subunit family protein [Candidatus Dormibacteraeota bacterium]